MTADRIDWLEAGLQGQHWPGTDEALDLCEGLIRRFREDRAPMPVVVLNATPPETAPGSSQPPVPVPVRAYQVGQVSGIVEVLYRIYQKGGLPCKGLPPDQFSAASAFPRPAGDLGKYEDALAMVRTLSTAPAWDHYDESYDRPYTFPRSQMLAAIEEAVVNSADGGRPNYKTVLRSLGKLRWMPAEKDESPSRRVLASLVSPATLVGALMLTALARVVTAASVLWVLVCLVAAIVVVGLILVAQQNLAPLSWLGSANRWFTTTTFMGPASDVPGAGEVRLRWLRLAPRRAWHVREARAGLVVRQLIAAFYGPNSDDSPDARGAQGSALQFCLCLCMHTLLEDLRANHHPWYPDLRRRKRTCPPMVFLPDADNVPGGLELLQAVSDVRSRRSEMDPLLIVASSQSLPILPRSVPAQRGLGPYEQWASRLRVEQSPSLGSHWPWVLLFPISTDLLMVQSTSRPDQPRARWSVWNLWSRWSLALAIAVLAAAGVFANSHYASAYCGGGLFSYDPNLVWVGGECIGIDTTDATEFVPAGGGVTLSDAPAEAVATPVTGSRINLADLESLIFAQNQKATQSGAYVTLVYAGALTGPPGMTDGVAAAKELAGVYAWQYATNDSDQSIKVRIDIANAGDNLAHQDIMAGKIVAAAATDPSIAGVIGLSADTSTSAPVVAELAKADLVVIDTTNSDDNLAADWNYFGLSATNSEEANALQPYTAHATNRYAVVFQRLPAVPDPYIAEQAAAAVTMLHSAHFQLIGNGALGWTVNSSNLSDLMTSPAVATVCGSGERPSVIYLAGRHEDLAQVEATLRQNATCFASHVIVLSGDDLSVIEYTGTTQGPPIPTQMTLYFVTQTDPAYVPPDGQDNGSGLNIDLKAALGLASVPPYDDPIFADGTIALAFDAADALYQAATANGPVTQQQLAGRASIAPNLRCEAITGGATGTIGFADVHHGLNIFQVLPTTDHGYQAVTLRQHTATTPGKCSPNVAH
jgi:hypothetical protein